MAKVEFKETKAENFPNLRKDLNIHVQEADKRLHYLNAKISFPRHMISELSKISVVKNLIDNQGKELLTKEPPLGPQQISQQKRYRPGESR